MEIPEIHEAERLRLEPGDILVLRNTESEISTEQAAEIKTLVRRTLGMPDLPVLVVGRDWVFESVSPAKAAGSGGTGKISWTEAENTW